MHSDAASSQAILTQTTLILFVQDTCSQSWSQSITKHTHDPDWHLSLTCLKKSCLCKLFWHHRGQSPWAQFRMVFQHSASYSDTTGIRVPRFSSKWYLRTYGKPTCAPSPPSKSPRCCLRNSSNVGLIVAFETVPMLAWLQGTVKGGRRQGRQRKRWEDNIRKWTGLEFGKSQRAVENREKRIKLVAKSSVVPQWPSRLRDWWWWWWWWPFILFSMKIAEHFPFLHLSPPGHW